jgi:hypothetical protein
MQLVATFGNWWFNYTFIRAELVDVAKFHQILTSIPCMVILEVATAKMAYQLSQL